MAHQYGIQNGMFVECKLVLVQHRHTFTGVISTDPLLGSISPLMIFIKWISGAIGTNDPIAVTLGEMEVDVVEQNPFSVGQGYVMYINHSCKSSQKGNSFDRWF